MSDEEIDPLDAALSEAQRDAIKRIEEIMREHFDCGIWAIATTKIDDDHKQVFRHGRHGGHIQATGLHTIALHNLTEE